MSSLPIAVIGKVLRPGGLDGANFRPFAPGGRVDVSVAGMEDWLGINGVPNSVVTNTVNSFDLTKGVSIRTLVPGETAYLVSSSSTSSASGKFLVPHMPGQTPSQIINNLALKPGFSNTAQSIRIVTVTRRVDVLEGVVGAQGILPGGALQYYQPVNIQFNNNFYLGKEIFNFE